MIYLDSRIGSRDLLPCFKPFGVQVDLCRIDLMLDEPKGAGDACFWSDGMGFLVGVERKRITDLVDSMKSKRLSGLQLPGMRRLYGHIMLIVEGVWRPGRSGELEVLGSGRSRNGESQWHPVAGVLYKQISGFLRTLRHSRLGGVEVVRTGSDVETAVEIVEAWHWFKKGLDEHKSHRQFYAPSPEYTGRRQQWVRGGTITVQQETAMRSAAQFPLVEERCFRVTRHFGTLRKMVECGYEEDQMPEWNHGKAVREWQRALGIKEGTITAEGIVEAMG